MDAHTLDLTLPPEADSVAEARTRLCDAMAPELGDNESRRCGCSSPRSSRTPCATATASEPLELHATWNDEVRIEVCDHGDGFTPTPRLGALDEPGGFGLYLIGRLADRWGVETDDGTTVWFVLRRH